MYAITTRLECMWMMKVESAWSISAKSAVRRKVLKGELLACWYCLFQQAGVFCCWSGFSRHQRRQTSYCPLSSILSRNHRAYADHGRGIMHSMPPDTLIGSFMARLWIGLGRYGCSSIQRTTVGCLETSWLPTNAHRLCRNAWNSV